MNPPLKPQSAPKARVGRAWQIGNTVGAAFYENADFIGIPGTFSVAILPFPSAKAARAFVKAQNDPKAALKAVESILIEANYQAFKRHDIGMQIADTVEQTTDYAKRVLSALSFPQAGGGK